MEPLAAIAAAIEPADIEAAAVARARFAGNPIAARLAASLAAAQHGPPQARHRALVIAANGSDHGLAMSAIADGRAPAAKAARAGRAALVIADAGCTPPLSSPAIALADTVEAGAALIVSLAEAAGGLDVLALAAAGEPAEPLLAGAILAAASLRAAIVLTGDATGAAAVAAVATQPLVSGYLIAAHRNNRHLPELGLEPALSIGLGGDIAGVELLLPLLDRIV